MLTSLKSDLDHCIDAGSIEEAMHRFERLTTTRIPTLQVEIIAFDFRAYVHEVMRRKEFKDRESGMDDRMDFIKEKLLAVRNLLSDVVDRLEVAPDATIVVPFHAMRIAPTTATAA